MIDKKCFLILFCAFVFFDIVIIHAQDDTLKANVSKFSISIGGLVATSFFDRYYSSITLYQPALGTGIYINGCKNFNKYLGMTAGLQYLYYKLKFGISSSSQNFKNELFIHEIQIPLAVKLITPYFYCSAGASYRYPFFAIQKLTNINGQLIADGETKIRSFGSFPPGHSMISIGKEFNISNKIFFIEAQYKRANYGNSLLYYYYDIIIHNSMFLLTCGVSLNSNNKTNDKQE